MLPLKWTRRHRLRTTERTPLSGAKEQHWLVSGLVDVTSGLVAFLVVAVMSISFSFAVFGQLGFGGLVGAGSRMALMGIFVVGIFEIFGSEAPFMVVCPDLFICPLLNDIGRALENPGNGADFGATYAAATVVAVGATGIVLMLAGQSALLRIGEFVPFPIVCGLLGAVGICLLKQSYAIATVVMMANTKGAKCPLEETPFLKNALTFGPAVFLGALSVWLSSKVNGNPARSTLPLFGFCVASFYVALYLSVFFDFFPSSTAAIEAATACGFLFDPSILRDESAAGRRGILEWQRIPNISWSTIAMAPRFYCDVLALCLLVVLKSSLIMPAWERAFRADYLKRQKQLDVKRELSSLGIGNFVAALLGTWGAQPQLTTGVSLREMGANSHSKIPALTVIVACPLLSGVVHGAAPLSFVPKFAFAGLLINQGWILVVTFFLAPCFRRPRALTAPESFIVIVILVVFVAKGMVAGLSVGAQCCVFLFAVKSHDFGVFKYHASAAIMRSTTQRSPFARKRLDEDGHLVQVLRLHSLLYFANASQLVKSIKVLLLIGNTSRGDQYDREETQLETPHYIIVDLTLVLDLDASAADAFVVAAELCHARQCVLLMSGCRYGRARNGTSVRERIERAGLQLVDLAPGSGSILRRTHLAQVLGDVDNEEHHDIQFLDLSWKPTASPRALWIADSMDDALSACEDAILYSSEIVSSPRAGISPIAHTTEEENSVKLRAPSFDEAATISLLPRPDKLPQQRRAVSLPGPSSFERILRTLEQRCGKDFVNVAILSDLEPFTKVAYYDPGDAVLREASTFQSAALDDDRDGIVFVESGVVSIRREPDQAPGTCQGAQIEASPVFRMLRLGPGGVVGVPEFFTGRRSLGTTRAETKVVARLLPFRTIRRLQTDKAPVALALFHTMAHLLALAYDDRSDKLARTIDMIESTPRRDIAPAVSRMRAERAVTRNSDKKSQNNALPPKPIIATKKVLTSSTPLASLFLESPSYDEEKTTTFADDEKRILQ